MQRTVYQAYYANLTLADLEGAECYMSKEELVEMKRKMYVLMGNMFGIKDVQTRALMEQMFVKGYVAAHIVPGSEP